MPLRGKNHGEGVMKTQQKHNKNVTKKPTSVMDAEPGCSRTVASCASGDYGS
jgi:hypothetical protein